MSTTAEVGGVSLAVRDIERVGAFYREVLGLAVVSQDGDGVTLGAGGAGFLTLLHRPDMRPVDPAAAGLFHVAYLLPERADLGRWLRHAGHRGVSLDGAADHLVSEALYLRDPEGNGIEMYADRDPAIWQWEAGQVVMANARLDLEELQAAAAGAWRGAPDGTRIGHVHLQVGDLAAAVDFYAGTLGYAVTRRLRQAVFLSRGFYHHHLAVNTWNSLGAGPRDPDRAGLASVTVRAAASLGVDRLRDPLRDPWGTLIRLG